MLDFEETEEGQTHSNPDADQVEGRVVKLVDDLRRLRRTIEEYWPDLYENRPVRASEIYEQLRRTEHEVGIFCANIRSMAIEDAMRDGP